MYRNSSIQRISTKFLEISNVGGAKPRKRRNSRCQCAQQGKVLLQPNDTDGKRILWRCAFWGLTPQVINNPKWGATKPKRSGSGKFLSSILFNVEKFTEFKDEILFQNRRQQLNEPRVRRVIGRRAFADAHFPDTLLLSYLLNTECLSSFTAVGDRSRLPGCTSLATIVARSPSLPLVTVLQSPMPMLPI